jgi:choline-sulfatase
MMTTRPPNVLLILSDQHRATALGCYGSTEVKTPHLDRLAAQSLRFDAAYTPCPVCVPGRYAIYTGRYAHTVERVRYPRPDPQRPGEWVESGGQQREPGLAALSLRERTLGHHFRDAGYATGFIGKLHPVAPHTYGFDYYVDFGHYADYLGPRQAVFARTMRAVDSGCGVPWIDVLHPHRHGPWEDVPAPDDVLDESQHQEAFVAREAIRFLRAYRDEPFCLVVSFLKPHAPWVAAEPYRSLYDPHQLRPFQDPPLPVADDARLPAPIRQLGGVFWQPHWSWPLPRPGEPGREAAARRWLAAYYACVTQMDAAAGAVLDTLDALGLAGRTLVIYTTDHGELAGEHGLYQKFCFYEGSARVPLLVRWPGATHGARATDAPVDLTCVVPTCLERCGLKTPDPHGPHRLEGRSLAPLLDGAAEQIEGWCAFSEMTYGPHPAWMVRQGDWKLTFYAGTGERTLFDLATDPGEVRNRAGEPACREVEERLWRRLLEWQPAEPAARGPIDGADQSC